MTAQRPDRVYGFRLHPSLAQEREVMQIIADLEANGWQLRQIVVDAILRAKGHTPEMYGKQASPETNFLLGSIEQLLTRFAQELRANGFHTQRHPGVNDDEPEEDDEEISEFVRTFAGRVVERQAQGLDDDDD